MKIIVGKSGRGRPGRGFRNSDASGQGEGPGGDLKIRDFGGRPL